MAPLLATALTALALAAGALAGTGCGGDEGNGGDGAEPAPELRRGTSGPDTVEGGPGPDRIDGGAGEDRLIGGAGDDTFLASEDDAVDQIDCGAGDDRVVKPDARDRLAPSCETVGWTSRPLDDDPYENSITVQPFISPGAAQFTATCPESDCEGELELRTPGDRKLLGRASFGLLRGEPGEIVVALDPRGDRLIRRGADVRVVIRSGGVNSGYTTRLETGG